MNAPPSLPELADFIQTCYHQRQKLRIVGNGSKQHWGQTLGEERILVSPRELPVMFEHSSDDLVVTVSANMSYGELQSRLERSKQFLAIAPLYDAQASIGGIIATGITGSIRHRYGGVRDMVLGIEFIRADGVIAKAGGKVVKNVAGYDLMKLLTGSWGSLALITRVTLRLYPLPATYQLVQVSGTAHQIGEFTASLLRSGLTPTIVDLWSGQTEGDWIHLIVGFAGISASVSAQSDRLVQMCQSYAISSIALDPPPHPPIWEAENHSALIKLGIPPSQAINLIAQFNPYPLQIHAGSGVGMACIPHEIAPALVEYCNKHKGYGQILNSSNPSPATHPLHRAIKDKFDPHYIFPPYPFPTAH
jgi:glycolate oxidase FAD binding subunit